MNAVEIVEMLREYLQSSAPNQLDSKFANAVWDATSLLESQQARITELEDQLAESQRRGRAAESALKETWEWDMYQCANREIERLRKTLELVQVDRDTAYEEMNRLKSELSESQHRERAAVELIGKVSQAGEGEAE